MFAIAGGIILAVFFFIGLLLMCSEEGRELLGLIFGGACLIYFVLYFIATSM